MWTKKKSSSNSWKVKSRMIFETHNLKTPYAKYIESIFHFKGLVPDHSIERVIPTGHLFLIFELDGFERNTFDNESLKPNASYTKAWVSGSHKNYISISVHKNSEMLVAQFKPFGAFPFIHQPINELNDRVIPAEELFGKGVLDLRNDLLKAPTSNDKFEKMEQWLSERFDQEKTPPKDLVVLFEKLQSESGSTYEELIADYSNTQKHLIDQFKKYVGLTPKYSQRIIRFTEILQKIQQKEKISWAQIAYQCGFSDQSYFIKEFNHFSGFNPQEFIKQEFDKDEPNFFPLDRKG